jgi:Txe/YoeB family toxin of toxin-antitoxin system
MLGEKCRREGTLWIHPHPVWLKHDFAGYWSRRIDDEHRLVYKLTADEVRIAACRYHYGT